MSKTFEVKPRYYEQWKIYKKKSVTIESGVTILVGCNGAGKSTLQHIMKQQLGAEHIQYISYDNMSEGGHRSQQHQMDYGDPAKAIMMCMSSEGENISINLDDHAVEIGAYIRTGKHETFSDKFSAIFADEQPENNTKNQRWIFLDAIDSGYSIDNIIEVKELFDIILKDCQNRKLDVHIVASANSYELCGSYPCLDVQNCTYRTFSDYEDYKKFILHTREVKDKEIKKFHEKH